MKMLSVIRTMLTSVCITLALFVATPSDAANLQAYAFEQPEREQLFRELIAELRCPKCQNQSLSDSDAPLAKDLRDRTYEMVKAGASKQEVVDFMVARYGDFAHYQPPVKASTSILWWGPAAVIVIGALVVGLRVRQLRSRAQLHADEDELNDSQREQLARLIKTPEKDV